MATCRFSRVLLDAVDDALVGDDPDVVVVLVPVEEQAYAPTSSQSTAMIQKKMSPSRTPMASKAQAATTTGTTA